MRNRDKTSIGLQPRQKPISVSKDLICHAAAVFMLHPPKFESKPAAFALKWFRTAQSFDHGGEGSHRQTMLRLHIMELDLEFDLEIRIRDGRD